MTYNTTKFDKNAHYASKSAGELQKLVAFWEEAVAKHGGAHAVNELQLVKMKLAERIGKKK